MNPEMSPGIVHFAAEDAGGGAAKAAHRLHRIFREQGLPSTMMVARKSTDDPDVHLVPSRIAPGKYRRMRWMQRLGLHRETRSLPARMFNFDREPDLDTSEFFGNAKGKVDVLMLHWITGLLTVGMIRRLQRHYRRPIVWLMMDMEPITGGCHYAFECDRYIRNCGNCPQIEPSFERDASRRLWNRKRRMLAPLPITFVAANSHAHRLIARSSLFGSHAIADIPVPLDTRIFRPADPRSIRAALGIPPEARVIFFGASTMEDPRKGIPELIAALNRLRTLLRDGRDAAGRKVILLVAGRSCDLLVARQPFEAVTLDYLRDDWSLAQAYQAADLFVCPSVEDGGPMMIAEAMICGTPVAAFHSGMAPDLITHGANGYLARYRDSEDLAAGMHAILENGDPASMRARAAAAAEAAHAPESVFAKYRRLFEELRDSSALAHA